MKLIDQFVSSFPPLPPLDQAHLVVGPLLPLDLVAFLPYIHWSTGPSSLGRRSFAVTGPSSFPPLHPLDQAHLVVGHLLPLDLVAFLPYIHWTKLTWSSVIYCRWTNDLEFAVG